MKLTPLKPFACGIDPGKATGIALLRRRDGKIIHSGTSTFHDAIAFLDKSFADRGQVTVFVETPKSMLYKRNESTIRGEELTIMFHAGGNVRESQLLTESLRRLGFEVVPVKPVHEKKWNQERYTLFTGSHKRTSEHERDAVRLVSVYANYRKELAR